MSDELHRKLEALLQDEFEDENFILTHWIISAGAVDSGDGETRFISCAPDHQPDYISKGMAHEFLEVGDDDDC